MRRWLPALLIVMLLRAGVSYAHSPDDYLAPAISFWSGVGLLALAGLLRITGISFAKYVAALGAAAVVFALGALGWLLFSAKLPESDNTDSRHEHPQHHQMNEGILLT